MSDIKLCVVCIRYRDDPTFGNPRHLVHPEDETPGLFDVSGQAVCPICRARWHRYQNEAVLIL